MPTQPDLLQYQNVLITNESKDHLDQILPNFGLPKFLLSTMDFKAKVILPFMLPSCML